MSLGVADVTISAEGADADDAPLPSPKLWKKKDWHKENDRNV